jgi:predicted pyridoxine 5'-phosphate oxidase superfamily flavin-nucleotide-binding protein
MFENSPWHAGEVALQHSVGVAARMAEIGRKTIRDHLIEQHREFYPLLPMAVLGSVDEQGDAWATIRTGQQGFLHALDEHHLRLDLQRDGNDPAEQGLDDGASAALLGIDLSTRRRNRLNGTVIRDADGFGLRVVQSFGNCPKYIQRREPVFATDPTTLSEAMPVELGALTGPAIELVRRADTLFVASYAETEDGGRTVDVSHRGGPSGFVHVDENSLVTPDYAGNKYFNTLGNLLANPRAGLTFVDFETGDLLQMSGQAEILPMSADTTAHPGAERLWRFAPTRILWRPATLAIRWRFAEWSPFLPKAA